MKTVQMFDMEAVHLDDVELFTQGMQYVPKTTILYLKNTVVKKMTSVLEPKVGFEEGVGLIGGYLGIFVGVSVISILEFLQFFVDFILVKCRKGATRPQEKQDDQR